MERNDIFIVCHNTPGQDWKWLARSMDFSEGLINQIDYDYSKDGIREKVGDIGID